MIKKLTRIPTKVLSYMEMSDRIQILEHEVRELRSKLYALKNEREQE